MQCVGNPRRSISYWGSCFIKQNNGFKTVSFARGRQLENMRIIHRETRLRLAGI